MTALLEAFDVLVVGDEPAAYWWIDKCLTYTRAFPKEGKTTFSMPKIAHLSLRSDREFPLPTALAKRFGMRCDLKIEPKNEVECILPKRLLRWSLDTLVGTFGFDKTPLLKAAFSPQPKGSDLSMLRFHISNKPELLMFAQGLWRLFGRSDKLLPESYLWNALQLGSYSFWSPPSFPKDPPVRQAHSNELAPSNWLRLNSRGFFELEVHTGTTFSAPELILAVNGNELTGIRNQCSDLAPYLPVFQNFLSSQALFTLNLSGVDKRLLQPLKPYSLLFEESNIPLPEEIHVVRCQREKQLLSIDFLSKFDFSLEEVAQEARRAYKQLLELLPDLEGTPHSIGLPLNVEDYETEEGRLKAIRAFQLARTPRYSSSASFSHTPHPRLQLFSPFLKSHLAYPYGQLESAQEHLKSYFGKRRYRKSAQAVEAVEFFS